MCQKSRKYFLGPEDHRDRNIFIKEQFSAVEKVTNYIRTGNRKKGNASVPESHYLHPSTKKSINKKYPIFYVLLDLKQSGDKVFTTTLRTRLEFARCYRVSNAEKIFGYFAYFVTMISL